MRPTTILVATSLAAFAMPIRAQTEAPKQAPPQALPAQPSVAGQQTPLAKVNAIIRAKGSRENARIVGGADVSLADNPWQVALVSIQSDDNFEAQFCGGSYLGGKWVVTAAHCVNEGVDQFRVFSGSAKLNADGARTTVVRKIVHPNYDRPTSNNDIALLELGAPLGATPIVPSRPADFSQLSAAAGIRVTGWGVIDDSGTASRTLKGVTVPLQTMANCNAANAYQGRVTGAMFCAGQTAGGQDSCQGDSGGPATATVGGARRLVGVVSWGEGCALANKYGVYTRVSLFADWIAANAK